MGGCVLYACLWQGEAEHDSQAKCSSKTDIARPSTRLRGCILGVFLLVIPLKLHSVRHALPLNCPLHKGELLLTKPQNDSDWHLL